MNIKLICSDIDGTLLNKDRQLSPRTISAIKTNSDIPFILISSRMPEAMLHLQQELNITHLPMIAYNGGLVINKGEILHTTEIKINTTKRIAEFCEDIKTHVSLYHNDEWLVPEMDYWAKREQNNTKVTPTVSSISQTINKWRKEQKGAHKIMCMGDEENIDKLSEFLKQQFPNEVIGYRSKPTYLEISHQDISKKTAIEFLMKSKYQDLDLKHILAFGDNYNDLEMLDAVGIGVAVQNAKNEVLAIANATTLSNKEDGVAIYMEDYFGE